MSRERKYGETSTKYWYDRARTHFQDHTSDLKAQSMKRITLLSFLILVSINPRLNTLAQGGATAPTMLTLEITFYPGRKPGHQSVPGSNAKPSGAGVRLFLS